MRNKTITKTVREVLQEARRLFSETHWTRGTMHGHDTYGKDLYCSVGGIRLAAGLSPRAPRGEYGSSALYVEALYDLVEAISRTATSASATQALRIIKRTKKGIRAGNHSRTYVVRVLEGVIISWNDNARNKDQIVMVFDKAIEAEAA